jgi:hypothetical protein
VTKFKDVDPKIIELIQKAPKEMEDRKLAKLFVLHRSEVWAIRHGLRSPVDRRKKGNRFHNLPDLKKP